MNGNIGMRAFSALLAVLLVSVAMVPAVSAYSEAKAYEDALSGLVVEKAVVETVSETENAKEYYVTTPLKDGTDQKIFVKEWKAKADGRDVWKVNIFEVDAKGVVASEALLRDSYYWSDSDGVHIHIGPMDADLLSGLSGTAIQAFGTWLGVALGLTTGIAIAFAAVLAGAIVVGYWLYRNADGSVDVYLSNMTVALIPVYIAMPGSQPIVVRLGSHDAVLLL